SRDWSSDVCSSDLRFPAKSCSGSSPRPVPAKSRSTCFGSRQSRPDAIPSLLLLQSSGLLLGALFCLPGEAGKPGHLKEDGVTPTEGKTIRLARASLANGGV